MYPITRFLISLLLISFTQYVIAQQDDLVIDHAWIAEAPPVSKVMVAYLRLHNTSANSIEIIKAESDSYSSIEFHETHYQDGMARMLRHESLTLPAQSTLELKRGGHHLMLFNPTKHFKAGETIKINFTLKNGATYKIKVPVKKAQF